MKVDKVFLRTEHNYDRDAASDESGLCCHDESLTKQSFAEDADINTIIRRFRIGGELPVNVRMPTYDDFTSVTDFHTAMNAVRNAGESFMQLPADVRARFNNDAGAFVDFCSDPANHGEAVKIGLAVPAAAALAAVGAPPAVPEVTTTPVVPPVKAG